MNSVFKRYAWMLILLSIMICSPGLFAMSAVQDAIATITGETDWENQIYELNDLLDADSPTSPLDATTQNALFDLVTKVYAGRLVQYKNSMGNNSNLSELNLMLTNAQKNTMLSDTQRSSIANYQLALAVEQIIIQNNNEKNIDLQVNNVQSAMGSTGSATFDQIIQSLFYQQLTSLFQKRSSLSPASSDRLNSAFINAKKSPLIQDSNKADVSSKSDVLVIEAALRKAAKDPNYSNAIKTVSGLQNQDPSKNFEDFTQTLNFNTISKLYNNRTGGTADDITALIAMLTPASTSPLLNSTQQAAVKGMLANLAVQDGIKKAMANTNFIDKIKAISSVLSTNASATVADDTKTQLASALNQLATSYPKTDVDSISQLKDLLNAAISSSLLNDADKAKLKSLIPQLDTDLDSAKLAKQLQDILAIQDPAARLAALQKFMADNAGKILPTDVQKTLQDGIKALVDSRSKDPAFLSNLSNFVSGLGSSGLLSPDFKTQIAAIVPAINSDRDSAILGKTLQDILAIQDPAARLAALQKFMTDNAGKTLPADVQKTLQDGIKALVDSRSKDPAFLSSLSDFVGGLANSGLLSPDFKTQIAATLPAINTDRDGAMLGKQLQDILAIQDPAARLAALQKFTSDNAGKTLPGDLQKNLQDGIKALVDSRSKDPAFLSNLSNFIGGLGSSGLLSPDFKTQIAATLPAINSDRDGAVLGKSLQDILAIQDPAARLAALQKFTSDNTGKTLPGDLQKNLQDGINGLVNAGIKEPAFLSGLSNLLGSLGNNGMLTPDFKAQMAAALPGINTARDNATLGKSLQDILAIQDPAARLAALQKFTSDNAGKTLPGDLQKNLQDGINGLVNAGIKEPAFLSGLSNLLGGLGNNGMLTPDFKAQMAAALPGINTARDTATLGKSLQDIMAIQDPAARLAALQKFTSDNVGTTLPAELQKTLQDGINTLAKSGIKDPAFLASLSNLVGGLGNSSLVTPDFKTQLGKDLQTLGVITDPAVLGKLAGTTAGSSTPSPAANPAALGQALQNILAIQDPAARLAALQKFMADNAGITLPADIQKTLQDAINTLAKSGIKDPAFLAGLSNFVGGLGNSSLVTPDFKTQLGKDLQNLGVITDPTVLGKLANPSTGLPAGSSIPGATGPLGTLSGTTVPGLQNPNQLGLNGIPGATGSTPAANPAALNQALQNILAIQDPAARLAALQKFMSDNAGITLPADMQKTLQDAINTLAKSGIKDPTFLAGLSNFVGGLGNSSLVTPDFKTQLGKDLQALGVITDPTVLGKLANLSTGLPGGSSIPGATSLPRTLGGATLPGLQNPNQLGITGIPGATGSGTAVNPVALNQALQNILAIQDPAAGLAALQKFMSDNAGIIIPADIQKTLQDGINALAKSGIKDPVFLAGLSNLVGGLGNSPLVTPDFKTQLGKDLQNLGVITDPTVLGKLANSSTGLPPGSSIPGATGLPGTLSGVTLPGLQNPNQLSLNGIPGATGPSLVNVDPAKRLSDIANMTDPKLQANALSSFVRDNSGKTLPTDQQQVLSSSLQKALNGINSLDPASLGALASAAQGALQPGLIGQTGVASISPILPGLQKYVATLPASIPGANGSASPTGTLGGVTLPGLQNPNQLGLNGIPGATGSSLVNVDPAKRLSDIANMTDPKLQANALSSFVRDNSGKTLPTDQQQVLSSSLQKALNGINSLDPASLGALASAAQGAVQPGLVGQAGVASISPMLHSLQKYVSTLPASIPGINGLPGLSTAGNNPIGGLLTTQPAVNGLSGLPGSGLKPVADLTMPGATSSGNTFAALTGLKSAQDFKIPGSTGLNTQAGSAFGQLSGTAGNTLGGLPGTGLKPVADLTMPGAIGSGSKQGSTAATLTGLKPVQDLQMPGQAGQAGVQGSGDATEQALAAELRQAMTLPTLREKMLGVNAVLAKAGNRQFTGELQNAYADAVQQLFAMRHGENKTEVATSTARKKDIRSHAQRTNAKSHKNHAVGKGHNKKKKKNKHAQNIAQATTPAHQHTHNAANATQTK